MSALQTHLELQRKEPVLRRVQPMPHERQHQKQQGDRVNGVPMLVNLPTAERCHCTGEGGLASFLVVRSRSTVAGETRPYAWGKYKEGWRIWGVPCDGLIAKLLGRHNQEFETKVECTNKETIEQK